jgi:DNA repair photolyase
MNMASAIREPRPAKSALTKTGGFLAGFSHTLQPYTGCQFGCEYCYVKGSPVHHFHQPLASWGEYVHPRIGIANVLARELERHQRKGSLKELKIFMSSATDPYQGSESQWHLSRKCLEVFLQYPPGLLVVQTRSPLVADDIALLKQLGPRVWLSFTIETDLDEVRRIVTPRCPKIERRFAVLSDAMAAGINVQIAVSPCLPYSNVANFGTLLLAHSHRVVVDSFAAGDGSGGRRTATTGIPALYQSMGWRAWNVDAEARALYRWLEEYRGERVGWSQDGFLALTQGIQPSVEVLSPLASPNSG